MLFRNAVRCVGITDECVYIQAAKRAGREAANAAKMDEKTPSGENEGEKKT